MAHVAFRQTTAQPCRKALRPAPEQVYAAIDLGTNNCRMLVVKPDGAHGFSVIDSYSRTTRLGQGLASSGALSEAAIERTLAALTQCSQRLRRHRHLRLGAVATEACRRAANRDPFLERVRAETGISMRIISPQEEARLAVGGCYSLIRAEARDVLVFDIGGGSTELILVRPDPGGAGFAISRLLSVPVGVVTLSEAEGDALTGPGHDAVVEAIAAQMKAFDPDGALAARARAGELAMLGTSGTVTTLAGVHLDLRRYDRARVDGMTLSFAAAAAASRRVIAAEFCERARIPCVGRDRAGLLVAGCAILAAICRNWPAGTLTVADRGVREGMLLSMMEADGNNQ